MSDVNIDVNLRSPLATVIGALGNAAGGIGNAVGNSMKLATKAMSAVADTAKAASKSTRPADQTVSPSTLGLIAGAAQENVKQQPTGGGILPPRKSAATARPSAKMSTEKLLTIAIDHLSSIDATLKAQMDYNVEASREQAAQQKEDKIENGKSAFSKFADRLKMKTSNATMAAKETGTDMLKTAGMIAAAAVALKLSTLKPAEIDKLKKTITEFENKWGGVFELMGGLYLGFKAYGAAKWLFKLLGKDISFMAWARGLGAAAYESALALAGGSVGVLGAGAVLATGGTIAQLALINSIIEDARKGPEEAKAKLQKEFGMEAVQGENGFTTGWKINGKFYKNGQVPERYQDIIDAAFGLGNGAAAKRMQTNPSDYSRDVLENQYLPHVNEHGQYIQPPPQNYIPDAAYNVAWNNGRDLAPPKPLSSMTVREVLDYQKRLYAATDKTGTPHTPVGAFQITRDTLSDAVKNGTIGLDDRFDRAGQEKIAARVFESGKSGNLRQMWQGLPHGERGYYQNKSFEEMKYDIASAEVGSTIGMNGQTTPMAEAVGTTATALSDVRQFLVKALTTNSSTNRDLTSAVMAAINSDPDVGVGKKYRSAAHKIHEEAKALESEMRASAKKEADRRDAIIRMTPGAKLASANEGKLEAMDPNYRVDPNNILSKYFVHFGLVAA